MDQTTVNKLIVITDTSHARRTQLILRMLQGRHGNFTYEIREVDQLGAGVVYELLATLKFLLV